jgi:hypothetical protein
LISHYSGVWVAFDHDKIQKTAVERPRSKVSVSAYSEIWPVVATGFLVASKVGSAGTVRS